MAPKAGDQQKHVLTTVGPCAFRRACDINGKPSNLLITSGCSTNLASESLVAKLGLPLVDHPSPYQLRVFPGDQIPVAKQAQVRFSVRCDGGVYEDEMLFDVAQLQEECIMLGRPWQFDKRAIYYGKLNQYKFEEDGNTFVLSSES